MAQRRSGDPEAYRRSHSTDSARWHLAVNVLAASHLVPPRRRVDIYRRSGIDVRTWMVLPGCYFFGFDATIGDESWINHRCYFDTRAHIDIGRSCDVGMEVMFCTSTHDLGPAHKRAGTYRTAPIAVGDGTWIGSRAGVLPGVTIGEGCVVAAGSVVTRDCQAHGMYAGAPARRIRELDPGQSTSSRATALP